MPPGRENAGCDHLGPGRLAVDTSGRAGSVVLQAPGQLPRSVSLPSGRVAEEPVRSVVVGLDVGADLRPGRLERLEVLAPDTARLELGKPRLDERLGLEVTVAAAAVGDSEVGQPGGQAAGS